MEKQNKAKEQAEKKIRWALKKLANSDKLLTEMAVATKSFMKLNGREMKVWLNYHKRIEDNTRWLTLQEVFVEIYDAIKKEKLRLDKFYKKYKKEGNKEQERYFRQAILTIGINVQNNIIHRLEKQIRKKYGYWKVKKVKKNGGKFFSSQP